MSEYLEELLELRAEFNRIDLSDQKSVRQWFDSHQHLSRNDLAQIAGKSKYWVAKLAKFAGLKQATPKNTPPPHRRKIIHIEVPENWDREWLEKTLQLHGFRAIATATGLHRTTILKKIKKWGIKFPTRTKHPCRNKRWVYDHYVVKGLSQRQCAELAGISPQTFSNWLNEFLIPIRRYGCYIPLFWVRKLIYDLERLDVVSKVDYRPNKENQIHVKFKHSRWETYYPNRKGSKRRYSHNIVRADGRLKKIPSIVYQYESDITGTNQYSAHIVISRKQWTEASLLEQRIAIHRFCLRIVERGWVWPTHPTKVIEEDFKAAQKEIESSYFKKGKFTIYGTLGCKPPTCRKLLEHFFDLSELWEILQNPKTTLAILNKLGSLKIPFDTHNMLRVLITNKMGMKTQEGYLETPVKMPDPMVYVYIFKRLSISGRVLDLTPGHGSKAVAAGIAGVQYHTKQDPIIQQAIDLGFGDFVGLDYGAYDGSMVDWTICDNNFVSTTDISQVATILHNTRNLLIFVRSKDRKSVQARLKPKAVIPIKTGYSQKIDYLFLY